MVGIRPNDSHIDKDDVGRNFSPDDVDDSAKIGNEAVPDH